MRNLFSKASFVMALALGMNVFCLAQHMNAKDAPCQGPSTTADEASCFNAAYQKVDAQLNQYYRRVQTVVAGNDLANLKVAQRLWLQFRDTNCKAEYDLYEGGTAAPIAKLSCLESMTRNRILELETMYGWRLVKWGK